MLDGRRAMAEEEREGLGIAKVLGLVVLVVLLIFITSLVTLFLSGVNRPIIISGVEVSEEISPIISKELLPSFDPIGEKEIIARLGTSEHFVKVYELRLAYDRKYKGLPMEMKQKQFLIRDIIHTTLVTKDFEGLVTEEGKEALKLELIEKINPILEKGQIKEIYILYAIQ
jgi:flagellar basal body-associated protein FliL